MKLTKKLNVAMVLVVVCLVLVIGATYAWFAIALNPEVQRIETNVGANGSLEIALLTEETFQDPGQIKTIVGDSAVKQDVTESNKSWGNVIQLSGGYGLEEIILLPARLNVVKSADGVHYVENGNGILKTAEFGLDGRIRILSDDTVSATWESSFDKGAFTYYVAGQRYGVRAIGTLSNLSAQQIGLSEARSLVPTYTTAAARTVQNTWREYGAGMMDILYRHYALNNGSFTQEDGVVVQNFAMGIQESMEYVVDAMHQAVIGVAAAYIADEPTFEAFRDQVNDPANFGNISGLPMVTQMMNGGNDQALLSALETAEQMWQYTQEAVSYSYYLARECNWETIEDVLVLLMAPTETYLGSKPLSDSGAFESLTRDNTVLLSDKSGVMGQIADFTGNFNAFTVWKDNISVEAVTASKVEKGRLIQMQAVLQSVNAAVGGWTRTNMDDIYGFAVDLAFRCNEPSQLQLQSWAQMRVEDDSEFPVTQGSGSYMQFQSDNMDTEQLITLMNTIRVGFVSDRGELLAVAKMDLSKSREEEGVIDAPLYLYEYILEEGGQLTVERRRDDTVITDLPQNAPVIVTVVVWLDGDSVDNSMVSELANQSMDGIMNLQFSSSADLIPSQQLIDRD